MQDENLYHTFETVSENSEEAIMKGESNYRNFLPSPYQTGENSKVPILTGEILSNSGVKLIWSQIANAYGYKVMLDKTYIKDANGTEYAWGSLTAGQHSFQVASVDAGGKVSDWSNEFKVDFKPANQTAPSTIIIRTNGENGLPAGSGSSAGSSSGAAAATAQTPVSSNADDLLFGFDKNTVFLVGGGLGVVGLLYFMSGKK